MAEKMSYPIWNEKLKKMAIEAIEEIINDENVVKIDIWIHRKTNKTNKNFIKEEKQC